MKKLKKFALFALVTMLVFQSCKKEETSPLSSPKFKELSANMQKLWSEHMQWTYQTVDAFFHEPDALNANLERLLENQKNIGAAIVPYYGHAAGDTLAKLLTEHIQLAVPVLTAAKENNETALNDALADWNANAKQIGDFLSAANPSNWAKHDMEHMMQMHIDQTLAYSVALLQNDHAKAVELYDEASTHMVIEMSKILSEGIAKQFPEKF